MDQRVTDNLKMALYAAIFVSQVLCGLATVTLTSRMIYAFSRDGGLPFLRALAKVCVEMRASTCPPPHRHHQSCKPQTQ